jgi:hypothetical protein
MKRHKGILAASRFDSNSTPLRYRRKNRFSCEEALRGFFS